MLCVAVLHVQKHFQNLVLGPVQVSPSLNVMLRNFALIKAFFKLPFIFYINVVILSQSVCVCVNITLLDTSLTLPEAKATAVSAITSALMDPRPPVALVLIKLSRTTSSRSVICRHRKLPSAQYRHG